MAKKKSAIQPHPSPSEEDLDAGYPPPWRALRKAQRRVQSLQAGLDELQAKYDQLTKATQAHLQPRWEALARAQLDLAAQIDDFALGRKLGRNEQRQVAACIVQLVRDAADQLPLDTEHKALHDRWAQTGFDEEQARAEALEQAQMAAFLRQQYDIHTGPGPLDERQQYEIRQRMQAIDRERARAKAQPKAKATARQRAQQSHEAATKARSLRSLYIGLAKRLHPDTEPEPERRQHKEEQMKALTQAYEEGDMGRLLAIELAVVGELQPGDDAVATDQLTLYTEMLHDQALALEQALAQLLHAPQYAPVWRYAHRKAEAAIREIRQQAQQLEEYAAGLRRLGRDLGLPQGKALLLDFAFQYSLRPRS